MQEHFIEDIFLILIILALVMLTNKLRLAYPIVLIPVQKLESIIQKKIAHYSLKFLEEEFGEDGLKNEHLKNLHQRLNSDLRFFNQEIEEITDSSDNSMKKFQSIYLQMLDRQPKLLDEMNHKAEFDEELIRKYLGLIDIEEFKMREKILKE